MLISVKDRKEMLKWSKEIDSFTSGVSVPNSPPLAEHTETDIIVIIILSTSVTIYTYECYLLIISLNLTFKCGLNGLICMTHIYD